MAKNDNLVKSKPVIKAADASKSANTIWKADWSKLSKPNSNSANSHSRNDGKKGAKDY